MSSRITGIDDADVDVKPTEEDLRITYTCQGKKSAIDQDEFDELLEKYSKVLAPDDIERLKVEEGQPFQTGAVYKDGRGLMFIRTDSGKEIREYCGANLTELVEKVPADGEDYSVKCPKCGNEVGVRKYAGGGAVEGSAED